MVVSDLRDVTFSHQKRSARYRVCLEHNYVLLELDYFDLLAVDDCSKAVFFLGEVVFKLLSLLPVIILYQAGRLKFKLSVLYASAQRSDLFFQLVIL